MNKILSILSLSALLLTHTGCEDNRMNWMVDDKLYVIHSGLQSIEVQDFGNVEYNYAIYKSGVGSETASASFLVDENLISSYNAENGTSYELLPADCYSIENKNIEFGKDEERAYLKIVFDSKAIYALQKGNEKYVLPLKLVSNSNVATDSEKSSSLISPKIVQPLTSFSIKGDFDPTTYFTDASINGVDKSITLFKLTDEPAPTALTVNATFAKNVTMSPDPSEPQDFNNPVTYTIMYDKGQTVTYTVQFKKPKKLSKGIRQESKKVLWVKTMADLHYDVNDPNQAHMAVSIATSGDKFIINQRYYKNHIYNWSTGEKVGEMNLDVMKTAFNDPEGKNSLLNYAMTNDSKGNLLISNLATGAGEFKIFKFSSPTDTGKELISYYNNTGGQLGRKLSIYGDLDTDAKIYATVTNVSKILVWTVKNGVADQIPQEIQAPFLFEGNFTDALANSLDDNNRIFVLNRKIMAQLNPTTGAFIQNLQNENGAIDGSLDIATFNESQYLARHWLSSNGGSMKGYLYNIDDPDNLVMDYEAQEATVFKGMTSNANGSGDIALHLLPDGYRMIMYTLMTNGGVVATLFDCVDTETE